MSLLPRQENPECIHCGLLLNTIIATKNLCITRTMGMNTIKQHRFYSPGISNNLLTLNEMRNKLVDSPSPTHEETWQEKLEMGGDIIDLEGELRPDGVKKLKKIISSLLADEERKVRERIEEKIRMYSIFGEKADSYFMKGEEKEGYTLAQAENDANRYANIVAGLELALQALDENYLEGKHNQV